MEWVTLPEISDSFFVDIESRSPLDLRDVGAENYIESEDTRPVSIVAIEPHPKRICHIWINSNLWPGGFGPNIDAGLFRVSQDYGPLPEIKTYTSSKLPNSIVELARTKVAIAHNAFGFDAPFWEKKLTPVPSRWFDTLPMSRVAGLPGGLDAIGKALLGVGKHEGAKIARYVFKETGKPPAVGHMLPFLSYNLCDVLLLEHLYSELSQFQSNVERDVQRVHEIINQRGVLTDGNLVLQLLNVSHQAVNRAGEEIERITNGEVTRKDLRRTEFIRNWCKQQGFKIDNLRKETVQKLLTDPESYFNADEVEEGKDFGTVKPIVSTVLRLRTAAIRPTPHKLEKIQAVKASDHRLRNMLVYWAAHTGRFSSRIVQIHNMTKGLAKLDIKGLLAEDITFDRCVEYLAKCAADHPWGSVDDVLASLMRCVFIPAESHWLAVADFASIEARGIAWIADEVSLLEVFRKGGDPYKVMASAIFGIPIDQVDKAMRNVGKVTVLGCGYGMSEFKFALTCANLGIDLTAAGTNAKQCVDSYRNTYPRIAGVEKRWGDFTGREGGVWKELGKTVMDVVRDDVRDAIGVAKCWVAKWKDHLIIELPSGRQLVYRDVDIEDQIPLYAKFVGGNVSPRPTVMYTHPLGYRKGLYGGLLSENIVQAICRDLLTHGLVECEKDGLNPVLHVHDEIVCETEKEDTLTRMLYHMTTGPKWAEGFPIEAEGYLTKRYGKSAIGWDSEALVYRNGKKS